ncbi:TonB-dependent receptor [Marinoscillum sp.]|uniref:TonB-dependent receptor n=1 Tax=Marinoscillum sp. TaxID=2024838 RepID=UPI003BACD7B7
MQFKPAYFLLLFLLSFHAFAQETILISGVVSDESNQPIPGVSILLKGTQQGTITNNEGSFKLRVPSGVVTLSFSHVQYKALQESHTLTEDYQWNIILQEATTQLQDVEISDRSILDEQVNTVQRISAKSAKSLPSTFGDFNKVLVTLPGVSSNNELSSAYSVRGGNFDENLVYVNDIPVYRPFLANAGRQEGLSFVNPDMVSDIEFYAGGWEAKYGDKLSSSLNIEYKEPDSIEAAVTLGLLGGTAYTGGKTNKLSYLIGARHRDSRYLLNTLETKGQYFPTYTDVQAFLTFDLTSDKSVYINKTKLNILASYGRNRYMTEPVSQSTDFGSVQKNFRLQTAFEGAEIMRYDTYQAGFRLTHRFNQRLRTHFIGSSLFTFEKEQFDVEGFYRLCDVNTNPSESSFDQCVIERGIGTNYDYGRNSLEADLYTAESRWEYLLNTNHVLEAGVGVTIQSIDDHINEYSYVDSADYVQLESSIFNDLSLNANQYYAYAQSTILWKDSIHAINIGGRVTLWDYNNQLLVSPRVSYRLAPKWDKITTFKFSVGMYQQPPFYRELRGYDGTLRTDVNAQRSLHFIFGSTRLFYMWGRPFLFTSDVYRKQLYDIIPYDIDNVRLRYYPDQSGKGFAQGIDFRVHGEFVKGTQSWFSVGFLQTKEDVTGDAQGYIRRPMDQRINIAAYFEDHMPRDPTLRVYLNLVFGSGYPFGPPNRPDLRNAFSGDEYYRADLGLSKKFDLNINNFFTHIWLRAEVLNALAADNTLSYTWIEDVYGAQFAIPNSLSARFLNIKISAEL